jgi:hypothetical protein
MRYTRLLWLVILLLPVTRTLAQSEYVREALEKKYQKQYGDSGMAKYNQWMQGNVLNAKLQTDYNFTTRVDMHMVSYDKGVQKSENTMVYFFNSGKTQLGMKGFGDNKKKKQDDMFMVYDYEANAMLMLNEADKTGMAININAFMSKEAQDKRGKGEPGKANTSMDCRKTGQTQTIMGYNCYEYVCTDKERNTRTEMWLTTQIPVDITQARSSGAMAAFFGGMGNLGAMIMKAKFFKNEALEMSMEVTNIDKSADKRVHVADYKLNNM